MARRVEAYNAALAEWLPKIAAYRKYKKDQDRCKRLCQDRCKRHRTRLPWKGQAKTGAGSPQLEHGSPGRLGSFQTPWPQTTLPRPRAASWRWKPLPDMLGRVAMYRLNAMGEWVVDFV